jgi:hypothetical protein
MAEIVSKAAACLQGFRLTIPMMMAERNLSEA